jgi:hypothetical protein
VEQIMSANPRHHRATKDAQLVTELVHVHSDARRQERGSHSHCTVPIDRITNVTKIEVVAAEIPNLFNNLNVAGGAEVLDLYTGGTQTLLTEDPAQNVVPGGKAQAAALTNQAPANFVITYNPQDARFSATNNTGGDEGYAATVDPLNQYYLGLDGEFVVPDGQTKEFPNQSFMFPENKYVLLHLDGLFDHVKVSADAVGGEYNIVTSVPRVFSVLSPLSSLSEITMRVLRKNGHTEIPLADNGWSVTLAVTHMV